MHNYPSFRKIYSTYAKIYGRALVTVKKKKKKKEKISESKTTTLTYFDNLKKKQQDQGSKNWC